MTPQLFLPEPKQEYFPWHSIRRTDVIDVKEKSQ